MVTATQPRRGVYVPMAWIAALIAAIGFSRRYFMPLAAGTFDAPAIVHVHGIIMFTWVVFLIVQVTLASRGRIGLHRSLGMLGISIGTLLVFTAAELAILQLARELTEGGPSPREFVATLLSIDLLIAVVLVFAFANVSRPEIHKRLIAVATAVILTPALARIIQLLDGSLTRLARNDLAGLASDVLIVAAIAYDTKARGKPHPAYLWAGGGIAIVQILTLWVRTTAPWHGVTDWLARLIH